MAVSTVEVPAHHGWSVVNVELTSNFRDTLDWSTCIQLMMWDYYRGLLTFDVACSRGKHGGKKHLYIAILITRYLPLWESEKGSNTCMRERERSYNTCTVLTFTTGGAMYTSVCHLPNTSTVLFWRESSALWPYTIKTKGVHVLKIASAFISANVLFLALLWPSCRPSLRLGPLYLPSTKSHECEAKKQ